MKATNKRLVSILLCLAMVLAVLPMAVFAADTTTLYCAAPSSWSACYVYWWGSSANNPGWPGEAMTKGADGIWYYEVPSDAGNVIFNNGNGTQSADLVMPTDSNVQFNYVSKTWGPYTGVVEEPEIPYITVYVEAPASWGTPNAYWWGSSVENSAAWPGNVMTAYEGNVYSASVPGDLTGLIFNGAGGQTADLTLPSGSDIMYSVATASWGPLEIKDPVEVTYTYVVAGSAGLCGSEWNYTDTNNEMTVSGDTATITYNSVAAGDYEFKVVKVGTDGSAQWIGNGEANVTFTVTSACDVTITFGLSDNAIAVAGAGIGEPEPPVPVETVYYLRGDMNGWDTSAPMTNDGNGCYSVTLSLEPGTYEYKAAIEDWTWSCPDVNASVTIVTACDVTFVLDVENFTLTASGSGIGEPEPPVPVEYDYYVAGSAGLCGVEWDPAANAMTEGPDGVWSITFENVARGTYEYKVTTGSWETPSYGYGEGNLTVVVKSASDVTITFNEETTEIGCDVEAYPVDGAKSVKWQLNAGASAESETVDLRLITYVETLDYANVSFEVTINGESTTLECQTVYEAIKANGETLTCNDVFGKDGYLVTYTIAGLTAEYFETEIEVLVLWEEMDGTVATHTIRSIYVCDDWS